MLPLIPGYLSFVSGVGFDEVGARPRRVTVQTATFVLGFGSMFALLGAGAAWFGNRDCCSSARELVRLTAQLSGFTGIAI